MLYRGVYITQLKKWFDVFGDNQIKVIKSEELFKTPYEKYREVLSFLDLPPCKPPDFVNRKERAYEPMSAAVLDSLRDFYKPYNVKLYDFLGRDFGWY
jgi:hypothetical protein